MYSLMITEKKCWGLFSERSILSIIIITYTLYYKLCTLYSNRTIFCYITEILFYFFISYIAVCTFNKYDNLLYIIDLSKHMYLVDQRKIITSHNLQYSMDCLHYLLEPRLEILTQNLALNVLCASILQGFQVQIVPIIPLTQIQFWKKTFSQASTILLYSVHRIRLYNL